MPEDEASWGEFTVMFATAKGNVRRNTLADFANVMTNGKIAMKFEGDDADDSLIGVAVSSDADDVLLATRKGKCIRFPIGDVRIFTGRSSVGVRGIRLLGDDAVISLSILRHEEIGTAERDGYLSMASRRRRQNGLESDVAAEVPEPVPEPEAEEGEAGPAEAVEITDERYAELAQREEFVLSITAKGFGVRVSAYDLRITGRGGQGIDAMDVSRRNDEIIAAFPVHKDDEIMLVTDGGQVIRCPVHDIRLARRRSQGVVVFKVGETERVVSVARLTDTGEPENGGSEDDIITESAAEADPAPEGDEEP